MTAAGSSPAVATLPAGGPAARRRREIIAALRTIARALSAALAVGYVLGLLAVLVGFRAIGERWWVTTVALYLPRAGFALPLPFVALALLLFGPRRLLWLCPLGLFLVVFPIMGLQLGLGRRPDLPPNGKTLRVLSCNAWHGGNPSGLVSTVQSAGADVILLQEYYGRFLEKPLGRAVPPAYHRHVFGEFFVASRYPLRTVRVPPPLDLAPPYDRYPPYVHYGIESPFGLLDVFNLHPLSPRKGLNEIRGDGLLRELRALRLYRREGVPSVVENTTVRRAQVEALLADAKLSSNPTLVAGDTNLPGGSWLLHRLFERFHDGFAQAGQGFGYTFPAERPWMRLDRIMTTPDLGFRHFEVKHGEASDHLCVLAEVVPLPTSR